MDHLLGVTEKFLRYVIVPTDPWFGKIRYELHVEIEATKTVSSYNGFDDDIHTVVVKETRRATPADIMLYGNPYLEIQRKD
jgi:hypothetical protein